MGETSERLRVESDNEAQIPPAGSEPGAVDAVAVAVHEIGQVVDTVTVKIDYAIIRHFSEHLYGSPNKAVEELVANGFDAFASSTYVYIPGRFTSTCVLVWDDGTSMLQEDLHRLWWIAESPKMATADRIAVAEDGRTRPMIGKFGIGKLASYAVGHRITHLCRRGGRFLLVGVDYRRVPRLADDETKQPLFETPIRELTEQEAADYVASMMRERPAAMDVLRARESWTLALIDELKPEVRLTEGRLSWVLGNGMPLRPDFRVWVNDTEVQPRLAKNALHTWDLADPKVRQGITSAWNDARSATPAEVVGEIEFVAAHGTSKPMVRLPSLGDVCADIRLFDRSLLEDEEPRSYGFFAMVRGRLINPDDPLLLLPDPSFGTFYRSQFVIQADGLDEDLLADRERLQRNTARTRELAVLQRGMYLAARNELERLDDQQVLEQRSESLLPITSREHFREPLTALLMRHGQMVSKPFDLSAARVERAPLGEHAPLAELADGELQVNITHPLLMSVHRRLGEGKKAQEAYQILDLFAVSERLFEGYLFDLGLPEGQIDQILRWRDGLFRAIATRFGLVPADQIVREVREASYAGKKEFEEALAKLFRSMGFEASRDGASGKKDVLVLAPIGEAHYRFTVEAKGSIHPIGNDDAEISGAAAHREDVHADLALVVAREFAGFERERDETAMILKECAAAKKVSIADLTTLEALFDLVRTFSFPLDLILPVLAEIEPPAAKHQRVKALKQPTRDFDFRGLLEEVWQRQQGEARGDLVPYRAVWQARSDRWGEATFEDFERRLVGLDAMTSLLRLDVTQKNVTLLQSPSIVADDIQRAVDTQAALEGLAAH